MFIDREKFQEYMPHTFVADASELGFPIGQWPRQFETNLGNGQPMVASRPMDSGKGIVYFQWLGCVEVTVYND